MSLKTRDHSDGSEITEWGRTQIDADWSSWKWQLRNAYRDPCQMSDLLRTFGFAREEQKSIDPSITETFPFKVTPHQLHSVLNCSEHLKKSAFQAFSRAFLPSADETGRLGDRILNVDGIGETRKKANPVEAISKFYGDRALFRVTRMCPSYCRYCFRKRMVGDKFPVRQDEIEEALNYLRRDKDVREVILSGGDPLSLGNNRIRYLLKELNSIPQIRAIRIDTRVLTVVPMRVDQELLEILERSRVPVFLVAHISHPYEITPELKSAVSSLMRVGVTSHGHVPLLKGVNDEPGMMAELMNQMVCSHLLPYYLIHFIPTSWTEHFRVPLKRGLAIKDYLNRNCSGFANPQYIVYLPEAGGKVPLQPNYITERTRQGYYIQGNNGKNYFYEEPKPD